MSEALARLSAEVEVAELEAEIALRRSQLASGSLPPQARRSLFPWEVAAQTNFAAIDDEAGASADQIAERLAAARVEMLRLLEADLAATAGRPGPQPARVAVLLRLLHLNGMLGLQAVDGASQAVAATTAEVRAALGSAAAAGFARLLDEAKRQGIAVESRPVKLTGETEWRLDVLSEQLATAPQVDLLTAIIREALTKSIAGRSGVGYLGELLGAGHAMSHAPLATVARSAVNSAVGMGRQSAAVGLPVPKAVYASEILDINTCPNCSMIDGHSYDSLEAGMADYPNGQYTDCEGGDRCRGTLVLTWGTESDPDH